jgi:hypothetical protein
MSVHYENLVSFILSSLWTDTSTVDVLVTGTADIDEDLVALYLEYYD